MLKVVDIDTSKSAFKDLLIYHGLSEEEPEIICGFYLQ
jgi:hypothetical protein